MVYLIRNKAAWAIDHRMTSLSDTATLLFTVRVNKKQMAFMAIQLR